MREVELRGARGGREKTRFSQEKVGKHDRTSAISFMYLTKEI